MINLSEILSSWRQIPPDVKKLVDAFISSECSGRRFALGRNEHSLALSKVIEINGFVDDFAEADSLWNGKPVLSGQELPRDSIVVNCSMSISPVSAAKRLSSLNIAGVLAFSDLCRALPDRVALPAFVQETRQDLGHNREKWELLSDSFADEQSRMVLDDLIRYRVTGDYSFMSSYTVRLKDQYFEDFLDLAPGEIFVDAGGYDGETTEEFCRRCPDFGKIFFFEPSTESFAKAQGRLHNLKNIEFCHLGLSDSVGTLWFNPDAGSASSVSEAGTCQIDATTLDQRGDGKITFIKMDLEGWELKALEGSKRHILGDHPKLAISVYHHPSDFWRTFEFIIGLRQDYDVYLRHYTEGWSETVMFFIPQNK